VITPSNSVALLIGAAVSAILCEVGRLDDARRHFELLMKLSSRYLELATVERQLQSYVLGRGGLRHRHL
jgi:hypothetical protein